MRHDRFEINISSIPTFKACILIQYTNIQRLYTYPVYQHSKPVYLSSIPIFNACILIQYTNIQSLYTYPVYQYSMSATISQYQYNVRVPMNIQLIRQTRLSTIFYENKLHQINQNSLYVYSSLSTASPSISMDIISLSQRLSLVPSRQESHSSVLRGIMVPMLVEVLRVQQPMLFLLREPPRVKPCYQTVAMAHV